MKVLARWLVVPLLFALIAPLTPALRSEAGPRHGRYRPGRIWVRFKDDPRRALPERARALPEGRLARIVPELNGAVLLVEVGHEEAVAQRLARHADVADAEPVPEARAQGVPNDPHFAAQWALSKIGAPLAWSVVTDTGAIVIAVIDTGVDLVHVDLAGRIWVNPGEIPGNGMDDDGNGHVDDVHGWSFVADNGNVVDDNGHGTHVAGIAAAVRDNGLGVAGVAGGATIMPVKVLGADATGGYDDVAQGVVYAAQNGAQVINLSLGGPDDSGLLQQALEIARECGALVVAAAGNGGASSVLYPAAYPEAMAVAATDSADQRASFSNRGPQLSVAAPGVDILSTCRGGVYCGMSGTSMATPHVAGLAALIWSHRPGDTAEQVREAIESSARDVNRATKPGRDEDLGYGRIDAVNAFRDELHFQILPYVRAGP